MITNHNIAIVAGRGLGDGLIFLVLANNLQKQGYNITFYNNSVAELQAWLPNITVKPYPKANEIETTFKDFDLVIAESLTVITKDVPKEKYPELAKKYVFIGLTTINPALQYDHSQRLKTLQTDTEKTQRLIKLASCSGFTVPNLGRKQSMAHNLALMCQKIFDFADATKDNGITVPKNIELRKYNKRVIIHPLSAEAVKNWSAKGFLKLARALKRRGWEPVFTVSPTERDAWLRATKNEFAAPVFANVSELAHFVAESGFLIGNDSGTGHLASCLGIPTLTIHRKKDPYYRWRPGWGQGAIVSPIITFKLFGKHFWRVFLTEKRILKAFEQLKAGM